jgi:hypothetical protein
MDKQTTFNIELTKVRVMSMVFKPFASELVTVGDWAIAAHTCGYILTSQSGYRFTFGATEVDPMLELLAGILDGSMVMATYDNGAAGVYHNGLYRRVKDVACDTAGELFSGVLAQLKLIVKRRGSKSGAYGSLFAAVVLNQAA